MKCPQCGQDDSKIYYGIRDTSETVYFCASCFHYFLNSDISISDAKRISEDLKYESPVELKNEPIQSNKLNYNLIPPESLREVARVLTYYMNTKGSDDWKNKTNIDKCYESLLRHLFDYRIGKKIDEESNLSTLAHAACRILFMIYFEVHNDKK